MDLTQERKALKKQLRREKTKRFFKAMFSRRLVILGLVGFLFFLFIAVFAGVLSPYDRDALDYTALLEPTGSARTRWAATR